jgi:hypothetical protein
MQAIEVKRSTIVLAPDRTLVLAWKFREDMTSSKAVSCYSSIGVLGSFDASAVVCGVVARSAGVAVNSWNGWENVEKEWRGRRGSNPNKAMPAGGGAC